MVSLDVTPQSDTAAALNKLAAAAGAKWPQAFASTAVISAYKVTYLDTVAVVSPKVLWRGITGILCTFDDRRSR